MRKTQTNVSRETINKGTNKMINLNLTKEEKEIITNQLNQKIDFPLIWKKYINKKYKNPNEFTKKMIVQATARMNENLYKRSVLDKVVEALQKEINNQ
jgi:hypothetical protein